MKTRSIILAILILFFAVSPGYSLDKIHFPGKRQGAGIQAKNDEAVKASYMKLPLSFVKNEGQKDASILFYEQGNGHKTIFTNEGISHSLGPGKNNTITLTPLNASSFAVEALDMKEGKVNYFKGKDPTNWKTNIATFGAILYKGIYRGIDMKVYGTNNQLEYDLIVAPGADPSQIRLSYRGAENLSLTPEGDLAITLAEGSILQKKPVLYQTIDNTRKDIEGKFILVDASTYRFELGPYDTSYPLVIDPVLAYSTYLGGSGSDEAYAIAVDSSGNVYVAGSTNSADFPTHGPYQGTYEASTDAFVTKLDPSGNTLVYSTYLGGSGSDYVYAIAVDSSGNAYAAGYTASSDFPTQNPYQETYGGDRDAFVTKLNPAGNALVYSTYLGGSGTYDEAEAIAVDSSGNAYVAGETDSTNFPTTVGSYQATNAENSDAFVTKLSPSGNTLIYSTLLGGNGYDYAYGIAVDSLGNAYVAGYTDSTNFPTQGPFQGSNGGGTDAFVTKLNPSGSALIYSTYLGGGYDDYANAIAIDSSGNAYVAGITVSADFPTHGPYQGTKAAFVDAFVTKLNSSGHDLVYSTYLGGSDDDIAYALSIDSSGNAYVAGYTASNDFPMQSPYQGIYAGGVNDAYVTKLNPSGNSLVYSTYLGGSSTDYAYAIAVDSLGNAYVAGYTYSDNFPSQGPYQVSNAGGCDAFVTKFADSSSLYATFTGAGVWQWNGTTWNQRNYQDPANMAAAGSSLYATFTGAGVWEWNGTTWNQLNTQSPANMAAAGSSLYATFTGAGVWEWNGTTWNQLNTQSPANMAAAGSSLYATFTGAGVWEWNGTTWNQLNTQSPANMAAAGSSLYATFTGAGVWEWNGTTWAQRNYQDPANMAAAGSSLYATFTGAGVWQWNGTTWIQLNTQSPVNMAAAGL